MSAAAARPSFRRNSVVYIAALRLNTEAAIYKEPADKVFLQGIAAGAANLVSMAILGTIFLTIYAKTRTSTGSLNKQ